MSRKARAMTSSIAKVRIHVERAIERLKNFRILLGNLPLSMLGIANQLVFVCAAVCNLFVTSKMILKVSKENWHTLSQSGVQFYFRLFSVEIYIYI